MTAVHVDELLEVLDEEGKAYWGTRLLTPSMSDLRQLWNAAVLSRSRNQCDRCGSTDRLTAVSHRPLHEPEAMTLENGRALCATCNLDRNLDGRAPDMYDRHLLTVQIPRALYSEVKAVLSRRRDDGARPANVRQLVESMARWVQDDLEGCTRTLESVGGDGDSEQSTRTVRTTVRVRNDLFEALGRCSDRLGTTLQGVIAALMRLFLIRDEHHQRTNTDE